MVARAVHAHGHPGTTFQRIQGMDLAVLRKLLGNCNAAQATRELRIVDHQARVRGAGTGRRRQMFGVVMQVARTELQHTILALTTLRTARESLMLLHSSGSRGRVRDLTHSWTS
jgi:RNase P/RNase MRP subunit POP5